MTKGEWLKLRERRLRLYARLREIGMNNQQACTVPDGIVEDFSKGGYVLWAKRTNQKCTGCSGVVFQARLFRSPGSISKLCEPKNE